jgi:hypothetical protein
VKADAPHILLVNPWIHDFAAYDVWAKPLGLLGLGAILRRHGCRVSYVDCLNRFHPRAPASDPASRNGRGPYLKTRLPTPPALADVPRRYSRYGIPERWLDEDLARMAPPDLILVTSMMTYWYPGVQATIAALRRRFPQTHLILGGVYASICPQHAAACMDADQIVAGPVAADLLSLVSRHLGCDLPPAFDFNQLDDYPYPAWDLQNQISCVPLLTSVGCPYRCAYCATHLLQPVFRRRRPDQVVAEIEFWHARYGVRDFVFYDDALLLDAANHALPLFEALAQRQLDLRLHTPNAVHVRAITPEMADLMQRIGLRTLRLGLETVVRDNRPPLDHKVARHDFDNAARCLRRAGFTAREAGAYLLAGLPNQDIEALAASIRYVKTAGLRPILAHYTPIPGTDLWEAAVAASRYDLTADPLFTNNAVWPCQQTGFDWQTMTYLKRLTEIDAVPHKEPPP